MKFVKKKAFLALTLKNFWIIWTKNVFNNATDNFSKKYLGKVLIFHQYYWFDVNLTTFINEERKSLLKKELITNWLIIKLKIRILF